MKKREELLDKIDALEVGESVTFKDYSEYFVVEEAMGRFTTKEFLYKINDQFHLIRVS
jgi:hypothetical protein|tara:strand:+ start:2205 stop:2378 length:174 start_codon:yes stop_codon:yes gene_type:complete